MAEKVTQTMELTQATQMLKWLEEERRKDKATMAALQERTQGQEQLLNQQAAQIEDLQKTMAGVQGVISRAAEFDQVVSNYKSELGFLLDQREDTWKKSRAEADRLRKIELEAMADQIGQMEKDLRTLSRHDDNLKARQAEEKRLNEAFQRLESNVADLNQRSDGRMQAVTYLEEQRRADNRRIAELEQETTDLRKKNEAQAAKLLLLEEMIQKHKSHIDKAVEQLKDFQKVIEEARAAEFRREQKAKQFADQTERLEQEMEKWQAQTQRFIEQYQLNKRALENLEGFQARVEKRQNEVAEMQRLAEDRVKRQWEEWQATIDKELKKRQLATEEERRIQEQKNQALTHWLETLEEHADLQRTHVEALLEARRADARHAMEVGQDAIERIDQMLVEERSAKRLRKKKE